MIDTCYVSECGVMKLPSVWGRALSHRAVGGLSVLLLTIMCNVGVDAEDRAGNQYHVL